MIEMGKIYRTRDGREVRIYAVDGSGPWPVQGAVKFDDGWRMSSWKLTGQQNHHEGTEYDLIESDPHGILPRHRELLAEAMAEHKHDFCENVEIVRTGTFASLTPAQQVALIALAKLDAEKGQ